MGRWLALHYLGKTEYAEIKPEITKLRGFKNGAFEAYEEEIDQWNYRIVINNSRYGGFVNDDKENFQQNFENQKENPRDDGRKNKSGAMCQKCGSLMTQVKPGCYECSNCFEGRGGCG